MPAIDAPNRLLPESSGSLPHVIEVNDRPNYAGLATDYQAFSSRLMTALGRLKDGCFRHPGQISPCGAWGWSHGNSTC